MIKKDASETSLFDSSTHSKQKKSPRLAKKSRPLAERLRPKNLSDYVGQKHILAPGRLLRRAIEADQVRSLILYGPPGTGKTTLARVIAEYSNSSFIALNAVLSGVKVIREEVVAAEQRLRRFDQATLLFIDEIHRFNQSQQDALLPWVERGVVTLIGATTENPYFEVNNALNSRSHIFQLKALDQSELREVIERALHHPDAYAEFNITIKPEALNHWLDVVNGDARSLLNALELAVESSPMINGELTIDLETAEASIQERAVLYDREGDAHFDTMSAYIKSMRGSDPDASLYWLAKMVYAGEPPRNIFRRLLIFASEDVGLAWLKGISIVEACAAAFDRVGMPEGRFHLAQATLSMATAPKSNSTMGFFDALASVKSETHDKVPNHLKDAHRDGKEFGHGKDYLYPHAYQNHWVAQDYLPKALKGKIFYQPSQQGDEAQIELRVRALREAQLEGVMSGGAGDPLLNQHSKSIENMAVSPHLNQLEQWVERAMGQVSDELALVRNRVLALAKLKRSDLVLDLNAGAGLLTWPATRYTVEGGVWSYCVHRSEAESMSALAQELPWAHQPQVFYGDFNQAIQKLAKQEGFPGLKFDQIFARSFLSDREQWAHRINLLSRLIASNHTTKITIAEPYLLGAQRLSSLIFKDSQDHTGVTDLHREWRNAESSIYQKLKYYWHQDDLLKALKHSDLSINNVQFETVNFDRKIRVSSERVKAWLSPNHDSYISQIEQVINDSDHLNSIHHHLLQIAGQKVNWRVTWLIIHFDFEL